ncbi:FkbM family methyltransferase [Candidatus Protochlamydia phocaeensis]|uniref:FkbM family methyltransferase n=1 Tax=Candidatus Protochlamydia phocaeensis TaxID=1414722 RepID=UPI0008389C34|nr:FkbM family methyltransferase [Candidatus Protochlamydia phocaeensis]
MKCLKKMFLLVAVMMMSTALSFASLKDERLANVAVFPDGRYMDILGYNNGDMQTNGEANILKVIRPGDMVFDVGAHIGEWSLHVLRRQPLVSIHGFEPLPMLFDTLKAALQPYQAEISPLALSYTKGEASFVYYPSLPGLSTLHQRPEVEKMLGLDPVFLTVQTERLDTYCIERNISRIHFLKIDTEGNEWLVLAGADGLIRKQAIDMIQFEYGGCYLDSKATLKQIYEYLTLCGYSIYRIIPEGLIYIDQWRPELENYVYSNYFAIRNN